MHETPAALLRFDPKPSGTSHPLTTSNPRRIAITFFPPSAGQAWLNNDFMAAVDQGFMIQAGQSPVHLHLHTHGELVQRTWHCINDAGLHPVSWIETWAL